MELEHWVQQRNQQLQDHSEQYATKWIAPIDCRWRVTEGNLQCCLISNDLGLKVGENVQCITRRQGYWNGIVVTPEEPFDAVIAFPGRLSQADALYSGYNKSYRVNNMKQ